MCTPRPLPVSLWSCEGEHASAVAEHGVGEEDGPADLGQNRGVADPCRPNITIAARGSLGVFLRPFATVRSGLVSKVRREHRQGGILQIVQ